MCIASELEQIIEVINAQVASLGFTNLRSKGVFEYEVTDYTYSVGFAEKNQPEIIITANVAEDVYIRKMTKAFQELYQKFRENGRDLVDEESFNLADFKIDQDGDMLLRFKAIRLDDASKEIVLTDYMQMIEFRLGEERARDTEVIQLLLADCNNNLPGEEGYVDDLPQPVLAFA